MVNANLCAWWLAVLLLLLLKVSYRILLYSIKAPVPVRPYTYSGTTMYFPPNELYSAFSFIGFVFCAIPFYWHFIGKRAVIHLTGVSF